MNCNPSEVYSLGFLYLDFNVRYFCVSLFRIRLASGGYALLQLSSSCCVKQIPVLVLYETASSGLKSCQNLINVNYQGTKF